MFRQPVIRNAEITDIPILQNIFVETIRETCRNDYTQEQIDAWTSRAADEDRWVERVRKDFFLVAESSKRIVGFASLKESSYVDMFYVEKNHTHMGVGKTLYAAIETEAKTKGALVLFSDVSITAKVFFQKQGFQVEKTNTGMINETEIVNFRMMKNLR